jgi:membrane protein YdbS with pleckstrin-like domain
MKTIGQFQFGIRRMLVLTTAVAVIFALSARINVPWLVQSVVAGYFIFLSVWIIMRVPSLYRRFCELRKRSHQIAEHRLTLKREALNAKQALHGAKVAARRERH